MQNWCTINWGCPAPKGIQSKLGEALGNVIKWQIKLIKLPKWQPCS